VDKNALVQQLELDIKQTRNIAFANKPEFPGRQNHA
jgi:hypothetical protein